MAISDLLEARLESAASTANEALSPDPQTRINNFLGFQDSRERPPDNIEGYLDDYENCPLVSLPIQAFANDVMQPGYRIEINDDEYDGDLDDDLEEWLESCCVEGGELDGDFANLLKGQVRDDRLRGTGLAEVIYDDAEEQNEIAGFRLFAVEDTTAYHDAKGILLQPDDADKEIHKNGSKVSPPTTKADEAAAYVQYDDRFGSSEKNEIPLAINDVVKIEHDPQTGEIWGRSDCEPVHNRIQNHIQKLEDVDEAIAAKAYAFWLFKFGDSDGEGAWPKEKVTDWMQDQDLENYSPGQKGGVPGDVTIDTIEGEVPEVWESFAYDVKYILSAMPAPKYRTSFTDQINRDIVEDKREDYKDTIQGERKKLENEWSPVIQRKAEQITDSEDAPDVRLVIEPEEDRSPLSNQNFDAASFKDLMDGLKVAGGGKADRVVTPESVVDILLKLDPDEVMPDDDENPDPGRQPGGQLPPEQPPGVEGEAGVPDPEDGEGEGEGESDPADELDEDDENVEAAMQAIEDAYSDLDRSEV